MPGGCSARWRDCYSKFCKIIGQVVARKFSRLRVTLVKRKHKQATISKGTVVTEETRGYECP